MAIWATTRRGRLWWAIAAAVVTAIVTTVVLAVFFGLGSKSTACGWGAVTAVEVQPTAQAGGTPTAFATPVPRGSGYQTEGGPESVLWVTVQEVHGSSGNLYVRMKYRGLNTVGFACRATTADAWTDFDDTDFVDPACYAAAYDAIRQVAVSHGTVSASAPKPAVVDVVSFVGAVNDLGWRRTSWTGLFMLIGAGVAITLGAGWLGWVSVGAYKADDGRCPRCGYARAGLPAGAACPECGSKPVRPAP